MRSARLTADLREAVITNRDLEVRSDPPFCSPVLLIIGGPATLHKGLICAAAAQTGRFPLPGIRLLSVCSGPVYPIPYDVSSPMTLASARWMWRSGWRVFI